MFIRITPDLKKQELWANGSELASIMGYDRVGMKRVLGYPIEKKTLVHVFSNPVLLTDTYRIGKLNPGLRDSIFSLYMSRPRIVEYDGVSTIWDHSHLGVWCPSIDTLLFARALRAVLNSEHKFRNVAEIGCGSGFLSKYVLAKDKRISSVLVNDLNPYAIKCAMENIHDSRAEFYAGDGIDKIKGRKFDLLICNPPYVPRPKSIDDNPYEGISLLYHLVHEGQRYLEKGGILVVNISSLCDSLIFDRKPSMSMRVLDRMRVPLKVNNILNNKSWLSYLRKHGLKKKLDRGYEYWHDLKIVAFKNE